MSSLIPTVITSLISSVDFDRAGFDHQGFIDAVKRGEVRDLLSDWLANQAWNQGKFVFKAKFVRSTGPKAKVKIGYLGENNLLNWFGNLIEEASTQVGLNFITLTENSFDSEIISSLGGVAKAITSFREIFSMMEKQPEGPKSPTGDLLINGCANIFYVPQEVKKLEGNTYSYTNLSGKEITEEVKDKQHLFEVGGKWYVLRPVIVLWHGVGWNVDAFSVEGTDAWDAGRRVFYRNSVLESPEIPVPAQA